PIVKRIGFLKDVSILIKGNIFRKSGDMPRLALIIALTVSFGILAAVQGGTGEIHQRRLVEFDIGSDMIITTTISLSTTTILDINNLSPDIENVMAMMSTSGTLGPTSIIIHSVDAEVYGTVGKWQSDAFPEGGKKDEILELLANNPQTGCLVGQSIFSENNLKENQKINISILTYYLDGTMPDFDKGGLPDFGNNTLEDLGIQNGFLSQEITILGVFDHTPSGIGSNGIIVDHTLINSLANLSSLSGLDSKGVLSSKYLIKVKKGADVEDIKGIFMSPDNDWVTSVDTFEEEMRKSTELQQMDYGIPGLLTADFVISLLAATLATFIFMSILMEKRKKEFAILRSYGASQGQIYKVVFSETIVLLLTSVLWGLFIGLGLSILFNGFFDFFNIFITPLSTVSGGTQIERLLIFDWVDLLMTISITFLAMLFATFLSVRGASKAKISTVIREL
ncbi:MAG: ABC transporter permease, partial [Candidatus Hodarchaeota archaeon]